LNSSDKKALSERDVCTKFITPALEKAGWVREHQLREEVSLTKGRVIVRGNLVSRAKPKRADYVLYHKPNLPRAVLEAKDNTHTVGAGMQQGVEYAEMLDVPFVFSSNGDGFLLHDRTVSEGSVEREIPLDAFPSPDELWLRYQAWKDIEGPVESLESVGCLSPIASRWPRRSRHKVFY
jgi:type I restriction enzyme R subunit